ncbi:hypothetical protein ACHAWF_007854 [Thalassiosira exigua]
MSLISSIFGGASAPTDGLKGATPDLFGSPASTVPPVVHKKTLPGKKKGKGKGKAEKKKEEDEEGDGRPGSSEEERSPSPSTSPQDALGGESGESPQAVEADVAAGASPKKTKEQLLEEESRTIFVGNLPPDATRKSLATIFKGCGKVASARLRSVAVAGVKLPPEQAGNQNAMRKVCANTGKLLADAPQKNAQGYVLFASVESVEEALKLNNSPYENRTLRVDRASPTVEPNRSVFVGNLPYGAEEETLRAHFLDSLGDEGGDESAVASVRVVRDRETRKCKGFGYVTLRDASLLPSALRLAGTTYMKRELRVLVCGKRCKGGRGGKGDVSTTGAGGRRSFEGRRAAAGAGGGGRKKRKSGDGGGSRGDDGGGWGGGAKVKRRRTRSEARAAGAGSGVSKRAATEQKVNRKVKKLQRRAVKMGKQKKKA